MKLLPCPFCGGTNLKLHNSSVSCDDCDGEGPYVELDEPAAIAAWNRRTPAAPPEPPQCCDAGQSFWRCPVHGLRAATPGPAPTPASEPSCQRSIDNPPGFPAVCVSRKGHPGECRKPPPGEPLGPPLSELRTVFAVVASYNDDAEIMVDDLFETEPAADARARELNAPPATWPRWGVRVWPVLLAGTPRGDE